MSEQEPTTGATDEQHWIISADPKFTQHEGGRIIVSGGTVYGEGYVIARAADCITPEQRAAIGRALETFDSDTDLFIARIETDAMTDDLRRAYDRFYQAKESFTTADRELIRAIANGGTDDQ